MIVGSLFIVEIIAQVENVYLICCTEVTVLRSYDHTYSANHMKTMQ